MIILKRLAGLFLSVLFLSVLLWNVSDTRAAGTYVIDEVGQLTAQDVEKLNALAEEISLRQQCGVYIIITKDQHGYSETKFAEGLYFNYNLGYGEGEGASGVLLAIAMDESYFDCYAYGAASEMTFNTARLDQLNDIVYDDLWEKDWYGACEDYIRKADEMLTSTGYHYYVPEYTTPTVSPTITTTSPAQRRGRWIADLPFVGLFSAAVSTIAVLAMKRKNKNTGISHSADQYIVQPGGVKLNTSKDVFLTRSRTVTMVPRNTGGGGGGGGSHSYHVGGGSHSSGGRHF